MKPRHRKRQLQWVAPTEQTALSNVERERGELPPSKPKRTLRISDAMYAAVIAALLDGGTRV